MRLSQLQAPPLIPALPDAGHPRIEGRGLGVKYRLGRRREDMQSLTYDMLWRRREREEFWALQEVEIIGSAGDVIGIIGANGAGKTTLCRVLSRLLHPDTGEISIHGEVSALLSLGTGFNQQLSGKENIFLNGLMLGLSKRRVQDMLPQIVAFSGLDRFIDQPFKTYSSGMKARLGFSIAAMIEPEILVVDEALSVGDLEFSTKAGEKIQDIVSRSKVVVVVSHQMNFIERYCTRAVWLDKGRMRASGSPAEVVSLYRETVPKKPRKKTSLDFAQTTPQPGGTQVVATERLGVKFSLYAQGRNREDQRSGLASLFSRQKRPFWALRDVDLTVNSGDILGIIGRNGAGKTTLCKTLSGILTPDEGTLKVHGNITALLTLGTGFNTQLSGRDNIYLNGMMLGIAKKKLVELYSDIVKFSELEKFIDQPVKSYSSGMKSRLGFSVAAMVKPDIFIIDEALSVGDMAFYEKASARVQELITHAKVVIVVTHNLAFVEKVCTRAVWLDQGTVKFDGAPTQTIAKYRASSTALSRKTKPQAEQ